jgi:hypothetical protein
LTILYYEVLRHFRVVTELTRQRPAVLVRFKTDWFDGTSAAERKTVMENILSNRRVLEGALLDSRFAGGFDAIDRVSRGPFADLTIALGTPPPLPPGTPAPAPPSAPPPLFHYFTFEMRAGNFVLDINNPDEHADILSDLLLQDGREISLRNIENNTKLNYDGSFRIENQNNIFTAVPEKGGTVAWADITGLVLLVVVLKSDDVNAKVSFSHITVSGIDEFGPPGVVLYDEDFDKKGGHIVIRNFNMEKDRKMTLPTRRRPTPPPPAPLFSAADASDRAQTMALIEHLQNHKSFYSRSIALDQNPYDRINALDSILMADGTTALQHLENRPLEVVGNYLAYPSTDTVWNQLVMKAIPTGGWREGYPGGHDRRTIGNPADAWSVRRGQARSLQCFGAD